MMGRRPTALKISASAREGVLLVTHGRVARSFGTRLRGLLGTAELAPGDGLLLEPCNSIHMFFMRYPIDAIYLDVDDTVLRIVDKLGPWRVGPTVRHARKVMELPAGHAARSGLQVGDRLDISEV